MARLRFLLLLILCVPLIRLQAQSGIYRTTFSLPGQVLTLEVLDDDLAHFKLASESQPDVPIWTSPMVAKTDYAGPSSLTITDETISTAEMRLHVDLDSLCVTVTDLTRDPELTLTTICPSLNGQAEINGLTFSQEGTTDVYGLGEQFRRRGGTDGNWIGDRRLMPNTYGNALVSFNGGNVGNAQFPIMYALGPGTDNYAVFVDHVYAQFWTFNSDPFVMQTSTPPIRWYVMIGADLPDLRANYMELTGTPPVPPKQFFGLWVSEYGYENWQDVTGIVESMRQAGFPLDGIVLDLYWFGGIGRNSQMGSLTWDEQAFPNPATFIEQLRQQYGVGIMTIEEPYVSESAERYIEADEQGVFVADCAECDPVRLNDWWGMGSLVDWSNPQAAAWWHDNRRQPLIQDGIVGHWTDLGEPEDYDESGWYAGLPELGLHDHASIHNLYNLFWSQSIWEGYQRNEVMQRPFILSRSGTAGSQRYGVAMWSGDIAANMPSLTEQMNVQMHMSLSGIDYFGSDVGGFFRQASDPVLGQDGMYSLWLANSALLDVPLRPHTFDLQNEHETAPSLIGDVVSNLANVRLRYQLSPYLYTLAHMAYRTGEAIYPPLVYYFQDDPSVRTLGSQKMVGSQMMMATLTDYDPEATTVYLPRGSWFNFHTGAYIESEGEWVEVLAQPDDPLQVPLFVRDGAVIPRMTVDDQTLNLLGQRADGSIQDTLVFDIYHANEDGAFTLIEDDGETMAYQSGAVRATTVTHTADGENLTVTVGAANGTYDGAPDQHNVEIRLMSPGLTVEQVLLNGEPLSERASEAEDQGWLQLDSGVVLAKSGLISVDTALEFSFQPAQAAAQVDRPLLLAHYMPWYQTPDVSGYWGWHWTMEHFNPAMVDADGHPQIASQFMPLTGPYDSQDEAVLEYQVLLMKLSGIDGVIVDWYGTAHYNDYVTLNAATGKLFDMVTRAGLRFALCYEDRTVMNMVNDGRLTAETAFEQGQDDLTYAGQHWFGDDAYVTYENRPLLFVFGPTYFRQPSDWAAIFTNLDTQPALITLDQNMSFGALAGYPWPPMQMAGGAELFPAVLESYLERFYRNAQRGDFIVGSAFPGFYDIYEQAGVRSSYGFLDAHDGETLRQTLSMALEQRADIVQLVTWNDYGEGTMIEPTDETGYHYLEIIQAARRELDDSFEPMEDHLRLPINLLQARRSYEGDEVVNTQLDLVFELIVAGDFAAAQDILGTYSPPN
ncbi:MAG: DUF5110 domain-containing protein [Anaerolineae bacterium]|nr:DUF5110 domain-containing protein [Anaerolineae bacterium]